MKDKHSQLRGDEMSLKEFILKTQSWIKYLFSKWYIWMIAGLMGGITGFLYAKYRTIEYTATTTFVLETGESAGGGLGQMAGLAALAGIDLGGSGGGIFQGDNLFELYKSRKMIEAVLLHKSSSDSSLTLMDRYISMEKLEDKWKAKKPELIQLDFSKKTPANLQRDRDSILQAVVKDINKNNLTVGKLDKKSGLIKVDVKSTDELFSKEFNEALVAQVNEFYIKTKTKKSLDNIHILQRKTDSVRAVMNGNISAAAVVVDATPNLNPTRQAQRLVPTQRSQFSAETNRAILGQLVQNLEMSKMALMKEAPLIEKVDEPVLPLSDDKIGKLKTAILVATLFGFFAVFGLILRKVYINVIRS
ncbi:lipopolysaccharide biosynthesis protein [Sphingobacterium sp. UBA5996]|uniref:lipopolysaccharide biosynthesis protein n=1 Tax=Sphingobacterium sp. UBA5996 TaxID=1947505 RepID=UPI0025D9DC95|nr:lipopolysaccharide biosynthesis protein [Sphingobacterium sp. UBA5996]